jgi:hypothetical protein
LQTTVILSFFLVRLLFLVSLEFQSFFFQTSKQPGLALERLRPDWKIIGIRRAAPASCLQRIYISLKPPAHEGRFQSG